MCQNHYFVIEFTLSLPRTSLTLPNARQFYLSKGDPLAVKVLTKKIPRVHLFSLRKSKIGFFNLKESKNVVCISLPNRSIQDLSDHGVSKEPKNPVWKWILWFLMTHHDPRDLGLICLVKKCKLHFHFFYFFRTYLRIQAGG